MADSEELVTQIREDYLTCSICFNHFTEPKALPCLHTFCEACLQDYCTRQGENVTQFACPSCRTLVTMPQTGVTGFPGNHMLSSLADVVASQSSRQEATYCGMSGEVISISTQQDGFEMVDVENGEQGVLPPPAYGEAPPSYESVMGSQTQPTHQPPPPKKPSLTRQLSTVISTPQKDGLILRCGRYGESNSELLKPVSVALTKERDIVISDSKTNKIIIFSIQGVPRTAFLCDCNIRGIAMLPSDDIAVCVHSKQSTLYKIYSKNGQQLAAIGDKYANEYPHGIAVNPRNGCVMTVSPSTNSVVVLNSERKLVAKLVQTLSTPYHVAFTRNNEIVISDYGYHCLRVFDQNSKMKNRIGQKGSRLGELNHPMGICVINDRIIVADSGNYRVQEFSREGRKKRILVENTNDNNHDTKPIDVAVTQDGLLAVLVTGTDFAEVRVYKNTMTERSAACKVS